ncbi:Atxe2 family lasso peptide isopeptidase [Sphingopyxis sp.]|uniref:Atxe2 family lasso peptide isopeptidase n=1 Tax=Sphingopyxis sp. TaxID=1908224 RepID=UPI002B45D328|nr:Atxe2 family lasso peptide isopeptidase [Sphingopyxis sp.]
MNRRVGATTFRSSICFVAVIAAFVLAPSASARCDDLLPASKSAASPGAQKRPITALDLLRVRDIGRGDNSPSSRQSALALSPDGRKIAFTLVRADPDTNAYCIGLAVMEAEAGASPRLLDRGGEIFLGSGDYRDVILETGFPVLLAPAWSPDGRWIAFLRRDEGVTQLWAVRTDGGSAHALTRGEIDVEQFAWSQEGGTIIYASRTGQLAERASVAREAVTGFRYDDRYVPMMGDRPMPVSATPLSIYRIDPENGRESRGSEGDRALLPPDPITYKTLPMSVRTPRGQIAIAESLTPNPFSEQQIKISTETGEQIACEQDACRGKFTGMWWTVAGETLLFLKREGWNAGSMGLYRWQPGKGPPERLLATKDVINGCGLARGKLICTREDATTPARIVEIDPANGQSEILYDPNPEFASIRFGRVQRLEWKNDRGLEVRGDLVLPPGYEGGVRLPLIVTTYRANGFLRGATGNEYPIHLFAEHGFAVLALERPLPVAAAKPMETDAVKLRAANDEGWAERWSIQSAVMGGVQRAIDLGIADPARIGITGLSDGASTTTFALINSKRFAAASISTCCLEPWAVNSTIGPAFAKMMRKQGFPAGTSDDRTFWKPGSIIQNAGEIDTPLLMQLADREYLTAIDGFAALREQGKSVDMYVFPNEYHNKWQPLHRLVVYERNLDWFRFWFQDRESADPAKADEVLHWRAMRGAQCERLTGESRPIYCR